MKVKDIVPIVNGLINNSKKNIVIRSFCIDTRLLQKGDVFIALQGKEKNGNEYIKDAILKKASCIITSKEISVKENIPIIKVDNTYDSLFKLATYFKETYNPFVIGITGSYGKTTTKEMLHKVLSSHYKVLKNEKNFNNHIGVPLTMMRLDETYDIVLVEMGMNHAHEIEKLSTLVNPSLAIITGIGTSHIGNLKSKKNIFKAKMEIAEGMEDGILVVNGDDRYLRKIQNTKNYDVIKCGFHSTYQLIPYDIKEELEFLTFKIFYKTNEYEIKVNVTGKHFLIDCMLVIEASLLLGIPMENIVESLCTYKSLDKRMNIIHHGNITILDDCYNASFEAFKGVLKFSKNQKMKKVLIIGDMLELGKYNKSLHRKLHKQIRKMINTQVLTVGKNMKYIKGYRVTTFESNEDMNTYIKYMDLDNKLIVIKGSRGMHLEEIRNYILENK